MKLAFKLSLFLASCLAAFNVAANPKAFVQSADAYWGRWQVAHVLLHEWRMDKLEYQGDDPILVGRFVEINAHNIETDLPEGYGCTRPQLTADRNQLHALLRKTMLREMPGKDDARAFGLRITGKKVMGFMWLACEKGNFGPDVPDEVTAHTSTAQSQRNWIMLLPNGNALTRWYGDTLLVLQRINPKTPIRPSFNCKQVRLPTEQAICASPRLSSYDASLAKAWAFSVAFCVKEAECLQRMREEQKAWIKDRNRCGQDAECLSKTMSDRLYDLMHPHD